MHNTVREEELSRSYLHAVCAYKGIEVVQPRVDYDSVDAMLKATLSRKGRPFLTQIYVQLKATSQQLTENETGFSYPLPIKNFRDLRKSSSVPMMLCVLRLPNDEKEWLSHSIDELILRNCMFWCDLTKEPETENETSVTIHIPWENTLTPEIVLKLMQKVAETGLL